MVTIDVKLADSDTGYVRVGKESETTYQAVIKVEDGNDDGVVTFQMNTSGAHNDDGAYTVVGNDTINVENSNPIDDKLEAGEYPLSAATSLDFENDETDTSFLTLDERQGLDEDAVNL